MLIWPPELPQRFLVDGYAERPPNLDRETGVELGVALAGRRATRGVRPVSGNMAMLSWQMERLDRFYTDEAKGRANIFRFPRPRLHDDYWFDKQGNIVTDARGEPILISSHLYVRFTKEPNYPGRANGVWWTVGLTLEALPS